MDVNWKKYQKYNQNNVLEDAAEYLKSGDPVKIHEAKEFFEYLDEQIQHDEMLDPENLRDVREGLRSSDPELQREAMEYQDAMNKHLDRSEIGRAAARTAKNAVKGVVGIVSLPIEPLHYAAKRTSRALGFDKDKGEIEYPSYADALGEYIDEKTDNYTSPVSKGEKVYDTVIESLSTLPGLQAVSVPLKGMRWAKASKFTKGLGKLSPENLSAAASAGAASQILANEYPEHPYLPLLGGIAGGMAGAKTANMLGRAGTLDPAALRAYKQSEIPYGWGDISGDESTMAKVNNLSKRPGSSMIMHKHRASQSKALDKSLGNLEDVSLPEGIFEENLIRGAGKKLRQEKQRHNKNYALMERNIDLLPDSQVELGALSDWHEGMRPGEKMHWRTEGGVPKKFVDKLLKNDATETLDYTQDLNTLMGQLDKSGGDYFYLKPIMTDIGARIATNKAQGNFNEGKLKYIYKLVSGDIDDSIGGKLKKHLGEDAYKQFKDTKRLYREYSEQDVPHLNKLLSKVSKVEDAKGNTIYSAHGFEDEVNKNLMRDLKTGGRGFRLALEGTSSDKGKRLLSQSILERLGQRDGVFNPVVMHTKYFKLPQKSRDLLLESLSPKERRIFESSLGVIAKIKKVRSHGNPAGTAKQISLDKNLNEVVRTLEELEKGSVGGSLKRIVPSIFRYAAAKRLTSPLYRDWKIRSILDERPNRHLIKGSVLGSIIGDR